jgi:tetratricopeptide (TPR) repeat protein
VPGITSATRPLDQMRTRNKLALLIALAVALSMGALLGGALAERTTEATAMRPAASAAERAAEAALSGYTSAGQSDVESLEERIRESPRDARALTLLGYGYLQRWRETADASFLPRAGEALQRAQRLGPNETLALVGLGSLALTQHEFRTALRYGREALRRAPASARPLGVVGDALLELGRYDEAFDTFERMNAVKPNLASYARIAYARELLGDRPGALAAMRLAVDASSGHREPAAWARVEVAKLELGAGHLRSAERELRAALALMPGYVFALEQLARVEAARGRLDRAIRLVDRAAQAVPLPQLVSLHGDLLARAGRPAQARRQIATVSAIDRLLAAGGIRTDLESAVFQADHLIARRNLVARARAARAARPSVYGDDALGWALARTGRCSEALPWLRRSLRLGTQDALLFFHRGYAEGCAGNEAGMRSWYRKALALNPAFSVRWSPVAQENAA